MRSSLRSLAPSFAPSFALCFALLATFSVGCAADATPEEACSNVDTVCTGDSNLNAVQTACEKAVTNSSQTFLNCIDAANTCSEAVACSSASGS